MLDFEPDRALLRHHLNAVLDGVNAFGVDAQGGWSRPAFSDADMAARRWLREHLESLGLAASIDGAGNVVGRWGPADVPAIIAGSHTDTVVQGGAFDGVFGVAAAVASAAALRASGFQPSHAIEVISFADEEGRFGGMLGSQSIAGVLTAEWLGEARDADGVPVIEAMGAQGLDPDGALSVTRAPGSAIAFLEAHVEQGPVLETHSVSVGVAPSITGVCVTRTTMSGQADHSGTTPMDQRRDALAAAAEAIAAIPSVVSAIGAPHARVTVGKLDVFPNAPHTIPGRVEFTCVLRDGDGAVMSNLRTGVAQSIEASARKHGVLARTEQLSWLDPVQLDAELCALAAKCAEAAGLQHLTVPSGAGHDAQTMQTLCPSALLFAPSSGGVSHAPQEHTDLSHMVDVTAVLARMMAALSML